MSAQLLSQWIVRGDRNGLLDQTQTLVREGVLPAERAVLNAAWSALAEGDVPYADRLLPTNLTLLGDRQWSPAAEGALIRALCAYACGDLDSARTHAGLAHVGLAGAARSLLLHAVLLLQASIAMHHFDLDGVLAVRQQLGPDHHDESVWSTAVEAIVSVATGDFDAGVSFGERSLALADAEQVGPHLTPYVVGVLIAAVYRDRGSCGQTRVAVTEASRQLAHYPHLPLLLELRSLDAHSHLDLHDGEPVEAIAHAVALGSHPNGSPEFQDLIDLREAHLQIRSHDLTRARVLLDRLGNSSTRVFLEAYIDAESRPSRTLAQISTGAHRWHSQHIEIEMIRARARNREPDSAAVHMWRALDQASESGAIRPLLDNPMAARHFDHPELKAVLERTRDYGSDAAEAHLARVLAVHEEHAITGPRSHALTARELEVLRAVVAAGDFASVAKVMVLSRWTVRGHFYAACRKLGVSGREAAVVRLRQIDQPRRH